MDLLRNYKRQIPNNKQISITKFINDPNKIPTGLEFVVLIIGFYLLFVNWDFFPIRQKTLKPL